MHKDATKCYKTQSKWCVNKHGASKIIDTFETYQSQSPQTQRTNSPGREDHEARREDTKNIITHARVNKSHYAWDEENYEDE
jgi:hypothetical protein